MSEAALKSQAGSESPSDRVSYFEQNIFAFSPFGTLATSLLILGGFVGSFVLACAIDGHAAARILKNGIVVG
ncbi:MAG: hypothetical protein JOZ55_07760, partial [Alphaproteobacteria bacterium]|nr:hypothetical protein [Alphaproteobacteria bacterium]